MSEEAQHGQGSSDARENRPGGGGGGMMIIGWALAFATVAGFYAMLLAERENPNRLSVIAAQGGGELTLRANHNGQYVAEGAINGEAVTFLLDTGATWVAVPESLAARLQLAPRGWHQVQTAAGEVRAQGAVIDELRLGSIVFRNARALIMPGLNDDTVLLGMNALEHLNITHGNGELTLSTGDTGGAGAGDSI